MVLGTSAEYGQDASQGEYLVHSERKKLVQVLVMPIWKVVMRAWSARSMSSGRRWGYSMKVYMTLYLYEYTVVVRVAYENSVWTRLNVRHYSTIVRGIYEYVHGIKQTGGGRP